MKILFIVFIYTCLVACSHKINFAVPTVFKEQANTLPVSGSKKNKMNFGEFSTSKIRRGVHVNYGGPSRAFFLENLLLNEIGLKKLDVIEKEKANFSFTLSDGKLTTEVIAKEKEVKKSIGVKVLGQRGIFSEYRRLKEYNYLFSALITANNGATNWQLIMTNIYDRKLDTVNSLFTLIRQYDDGLVTNGKDTIYIKALMLKETESPNGKKGKMPFEMLGGYELSTTDGVIGIVDIIGANVWFYNELNASERLNIAAIATAILARRVNNSAW